MGYSVDTLGTYSPGWLVTAGLFLIAGLLAYRVPPPSGSNLAVT
jgi:hypothetical protein